MATYYKAKSKGRPYESVRFIQIFEQNSSLHLSFESGLFTKIIG